MAKFPHSPILHYAYSSLFIENNTGNNGAPEGVSFYRCKPESRKQKPEIYLLVPAWATSFLKM